MLDGADGRIFLERGWAEAAGSGAKMHDRPMADPVPLADHMLGVAARQLWVILIPLVMIPAIAAVAINRMPAQYTATGSVLYDPASYTPDILQSIVKTDPTTDTVVASQGAILASGAMADRLSRTLNLAHQPGFRASPTLALAAQPQAVDALALKAIKVSQIDASRVFAVSFTARDPALAAEAVNLILDLYLADQLAAKTAALNAADVWMQRRAEALNTKLLAQEAALASYRASHGLTQGVQARIGTEELSALGEDMMRAENDLAGADATQSAGAATVAGVAPNVVAMRLAEAQVQAQLDAVRTRLGPNHPQVRALREQLQALQSATGAEITSVQAHVAGDADAAAARLARLRQSLLLLKAEGIAESAAEGPLAAMAQDVEATRKLRLSLLAQMDQTAQQAAIQTPDARILSRAEPPLSPSSPKTLLLMAAGVLAGLAAGLGLAWLREAGHMTFRTEADVRAALALPVIGTVPHVRGRDQRDVGAAMSAEGGLSARQIDDLRLRTKLTLGDPMVLALVSSRPGEGRSTLALALARRAALGGERVLLISCAGAPAADVLALMPERDALSGCAILSVSAGAGPSFTTLRGMLSGESWRRNFDLILLDAPPVLTGAAALALADLADAVLFCLHWNRTPRHLAVHARRRLVLPNSRPIAAVLMQIEPHARALRGFPEAQMA